MNTILRIFLVLALIYGFVGTGTAAPDPLTRVERIRGQSREDVSLSPRMNPRGTVVYKARGGRTFILYDDQESISVHLFRAPELGLWNADTCGSSRENAGMPPGWQETPVIRMDDSMTPDGADFDR